MYNILFGSMLIWNQKRGIGCILLKSIFTFNGVLRVFVRAGTKLHTQVLLIIEF